MDPLLSQIKAMRESIGVESNWLGNKDFELIGCALEAVITDDATREAGLWGGDLLTRALSKLSKVVDKYTPIPFDDKPSDCDSYLGFAKGRWWTVMYDDIDGISDVYGLDFTHYLPLPPNPEQR